jgi:hypothetical protein
VFAIGAVILYQFTLGRAAAADIKDRAALVDTGR